MSGDIPTAEFRAAMHRVADMVADYLEQVGEYPVLPPVDPGAVAATLTASPPEQGEPIDRLLADYRQKIEPNLTHWNHPGFMGYFAITGSGPGIVGETLAAALNVNAMLWRTSPAATELEERVCDWLRQMVGLPTEFRGHINDTASISTLLALAMARHRQTDLDIRNKGMLGRPDMPPLVVYWSDQAHSSCDKAAMTLGLGLDNVRRIPSDGVFRMMPEALEEAISKDLEAGRRPLAVVATLGTTATTSVDPVEAIAQICSEHGIFLHVDAAYAGSAAICSEHRSLFAGWEHADSIVLNPHKWLFTPFDCSVMLVRDPQELKDAFSLVPEYLKSSEEGVTNLMDFGVQLGRRFRSLKLWMVIRAFGVEGLRQRIRDHCAMASTLAGWVEADPDFQVAAPVPFSTVCFRWLVGEGSEQRNKLNRQLLEEVNRAGPVFLSHAVIDDEVVLRAAIGNLRTSHEHVEQMWRLVRSAADSLADQ